MREAILDLLKHKPFYRFRIVTTSGRDYIIDDPARVAVGRNIMHVFLARSDRYFTVKLRDVVAAVVGEGRRPKRD